MYSKSLSYIFILLLAAQPAYAGAGKILFREDFNDLKNWEPLYFPKIEKHSTYSIESNGAESFLKTQSQASASGIVYKKEFKVYEFPQVSWQWKVENVYQKGAAKSKAGDDYPLRIYIMFKYNPAEAGVWEKLKYKAAKLIYGKYPPHSSLNYIWANRQYPENIITSAYTEKAQMILLQKGKLNIGKWMSQNINIIAGYKRAFGKKPPSIAKIAIMNDADNTGESATSYVNYIQVYAP